MLFDRFEQLLREIGADIDTNTAKAIYSLVGAGYLKVINGRTYPPLNLEDWAYIYKPDLFEKWSAAKDEDESNACLNIIKAYIESC